MFSIAASIAGRWLAVFLLALLSVSVLPTEIRAQQDTEEEARMPVRVIGGRLVLRCEISTKFRRLPMNLFVDYDRPCGLELHNQAANGIKVDADGGVPMTIHLHGFNIKVERREHGDEDLLNDFTKLYSKELGEVACAGTIGTKIMSRYHVTFDLTAGFIYLKPPRERSLEAPQAEAGEAISAITLVNDLVWFPVRLADGRLMTMNLASVRHDTIVDEDLCDVMGAPAGNIGAVSLGRFDLSKYIAFRPEELVQVHSDGALGTTGINLLEHFRVEVDRENRWIRLKETVPAKFPEADLAFFKAMIEEEAAPLLTYLEKHPGSRLSREAAELVIGHLLDEGAATDSFDTGLMWMDKTRIEDLRATEALNTMKMLIEARRSDVAIAAGKIGVKSGRKDRYPEAVHRLHAKLGELLLETERTEESWEHLLSAAFGLPEDGMISLHLGRFYEKSKRYKRAMSRYVQAVISAESGPQAIAGLERVQSKLGGEALSVDLVDKLISGKVYNFGAATTFEPDKETQTNRVVLVELFTNAHFGRRVREGWRSFAVGGAMGIEGLLSHFPRERVAVLSYHVAQPEPTALMNSLSMHAAQMYGDLRPVYMKIDGTATGPGAGRWRDAEGIYSRNRALVMRHLKQASDHTIDGKVRVDGGEISGEINFRGPAGRGLLVQVVLAEKSVLYPGKANVVVHRMVARHTLTNSLDGLEYKPEKGTMTFTFKKSLAQIKAENESFLEKFEAADGGNTSRLSTKIDARQVCVVAIIRNPATDGVLQACYIDTQGAGGKGAR